MLGTTTAGRAPAVAALELETLEECARTFEPATFALELARYLAAVDAYRAADAAPKWRAESDERRNQV